ncbi:protein-export chaperone SecB [Schinkia azotoformans]|uniref:protein-export chaperone SecB n=1 Tax=Schinkia azotoformans TaxID=1454 RepID=UPI002DBCDC5F|nr:protein-export chaperone SecB [Schinkia azotoformans]MEC1718771.1 protein-export chaperone SecB [Schinkia azotoformans]MED4413017.1 protein-export chaperone SecB [Schinkia azotoformans]
MKAVLQFRDYHVLETTYKNNPYKTVEEEKPLHPNIFFKLDVNPENISQAIVGLGIELGDSNLKETSFYVKVRISGLFEILSEIDVVNENQIINFYKVNAVAILFPYLRSLVSDITSKGSEAPVILPTLNIAAMINENELEENEDEFAELE